MTTGSTRAGSSSSWSTTPTSLRSRAGSPSIGSSAASSPPASMTPSPARYAPSACTTRPSFNMPTGRIAIVAAGVVTPIGQDLDTFWSGLLPGADGTSVVERFPVGDLRVGRGGEIKKLTRAVDWRRVSDCRATRLLVSAADDLCVQAGERPIRVEPERLAVVVGTALGGVEEGERALSGGSARRLRAALYDAPAHGLARWLGARGPAVTVSTACASGATALGVGAEMLRRGEADAVVAGGYDILCRFVMRGFDGLRSLTRERVRPFDRRRSGLLLGEAAGLLLLRREREAGARRLGTLLGYGSASDAVHIAAPDPEGRGL